MSYGGYEYNAPGFGFDPMGMGGGFGTDNGGGFMDSGNAPGSATKTDKKTRDRQTLLPLTIKQVHTIDDGKLGNAEVFNIRILGVILSIETHATNVVYRISDGTGVIECKCFVEKDAGGVKFPDCRENKLVCINGNIRVYDGTKSVMIFRMNLVNDWNQLTHHFLECVLTHLRNSGAAPKVNMSFSAPGAPASHGQTLKNAPSEDPVKILRDKILNVYRQDDSDVGPDFVSALQRLLASGVNISMTQLRKEVEYLNEEGLMYTTVDDLHYKAT